MKAIADLGEQLSSASAPLIFSSSLGVDRQILGGAFAIHSDYWRCFRHFLELTVEMGNREVEATQI